MMQFGSDPGGGPKSEPPKERTSISKAPSLSSESAICASQTLWDCLRSYRGIKPAGFIRE